MFSPYREVYSRCLLGPDGYPLWNPQLNTELCESYQLEGLKIGDVGLLSPKNGSFDVLFNITLPREEQPYPEFVGEEFTPVPLNRQRDLDTQRNAVTPTQCVFPRGSVQLVSRPRFGEVRSRDQEPPRVAYEFNLSVEDGAVLILPEGAESCDLKNERKFLNEAIRCGTDWYTCATQTAGRLIGRNESLYLITGFHKARSWSLGATCRGSSGTQDTRSLRFEVGEINPGGVAARAYSWEPVQGFLGHVGPLSPYEIPSYTTDDRRHGVNQTVFIRGFRITVNDLLFLKTVTVKTQEGVAFGGLKDYVKDLIWGRPSESTQSPAAGGQMDNTAEQDFVGKNARLHMDTHMAVDRLPDVSQPFHPGDLINKYLLQKQPLAKIAVTHDSLWIEMLCTGLLKLDDFSHGRELQKVLSTTFQIVVEDDAVYLQKGPPKHSESILSPGTLFDIHDNFPGPSDVPISAYDHIFNLNPIKPLFASEHAASYPVVPHNESPIVSPPPVSMGHVCKWFDGDIICGAYITPTSIGDHLTTHGIKNLAGASRLSCKWEGCSMIMRRESILRHVREVHLGCKRGTSSGPAHSD